MLTGSVIFGLGTVTGLMAQLPSDSANRVELHRAELSGAEHMEMIISSAEYQPGELLRRHSHHGLEAVYIVQGAEVQAPDKAPMTLATGASLLNLRDIPHGGFIIAGDQPLKIFTVHVVDKSAPLYQFTDR
ncbi:hypothetical protein GCM10027098_25960 [Bowmanella dokdonensis]